VSAGVEREQNGVEATAHAASQAARRLGPAERLVAGVLDLAGARSLALDALLSVSAIEWSDGIGSACVECADRPRLLLNPVFVERFCTSRERLAMLILHELSHISLGHTRLYPRLTPLHNVAFDAVINASLLGGLERRGIEARPYAALVEDTYGPAEAPYFLLRPPPGWPGNFSWAASEGCDERLREIHRRLYSYRADARGGVNGVTYTEIVSALADAGRTCGGPGEGEGDERLVGRLLGAHGSTDLERVSCTSGRDVNAAEALHEVLEALHVDGGEAAGPGGGTYLQRIERRRGERALERALAALLRRVFLEGQGGTPRWVEFTAPSVSPDPVRDRRAATRQHAARMLGAPAPLLFRSEIVRRRPRRRSAAVYLDVSGSMTGLLERLHASLVPLRRLLAAEVFVFSTRVVPVARAAFLRGELPSTGGTSIEPVLRHLAAQASCPPGRAGHTRPRRALVLTDGWFDQPSRSAAAALSAGGHALHLGVLGPGPLHDRAAWVASSTRLPDPIHSSTPR
jgi:hypothetical protein